MNMIQANISGGKTIVIPIAPMRKSINPIIPIILFN